jgi:hypothetical protein
VSGKRGRRRMSITTFRKKVDNLRTELPHHNEEHKLYRQISSMAEPMLHLKSQVSDAEIWKSMARTGSRLIEKVTGKSSNRKSSRSGRGLIFGSSRDDDDSGSDGGSDGGDIMSVRDEVPVPVPRVRRESTLLQVKTLLHHLIDIFNIAQELVYCYCL